MRIDKIIVPLAIQEKLATRHQVEVEEARHLLLRDCLNITSRFLGDFAREKREVVFRRLLSQPRIRFAEKGHTIGEDVYAAFGRTFGDRFLAVFFVYKPTSHTAIVISARDMSQTERRRYGRK